MSTTSPGLKAPELPSWQPGLPLAQRTEQGTYLPKPLDDEVLKRLLYLDAYPGLCQKSLDADEQICELRMQQQREPLSWRWPAVFGIVTGVIVGYVFGHH